MTSAGGWAVEQQRGRAEDLHLLDPATGDGRRVWHMVVDRPALVLGSTQPLTDVDVGAADRLGIEVARRRSGGGAVLMVPGESLWVDVIVPRDDELWDDDVNRSFAWIGAAWCSAVGLQLDRPFHLGVHDGPLVRGAAGSAVCFAGLGPGEVVLDGQKLVGLSQRRTRHFARYQCSVHHAWWPDTYLELLEPALGSMDEPLPPVATIADGDALLASFLATLTTR